MSASNNWSSRLSEILILILGVLIAFFLNSWNENRKDQARVELFLTGIEEELAENLEELKKTIPYHQKLLATLREDPTSANLVLQPPLVNDVAWKLAENDLFKQGVDPDTYKALARTYQMHDVVMQHSTAAGQRMTEINTLSPFWLAAFMKDNPGKDDLEYLGREMKNGWKPIFETWIYFEEEYLESVERSLQLMSNS